MKTGNRGEWSEVYVLLKLLADGVVYGGDADLEKVAELIYPIVKILRDDSAGKVEYAIQKDIVIISEKKEIARIPVQQFAEKALILLYKINKSKGAFSVPELTSFLESISCSSLKAKSSSKTDINLVIYDKQVNQNVKLGFSIKSQLGGDSTLLNAGKTTNFIYKINRFRGTDRDIARINSIESRSKIKDRLKEIKDKKGELKFTKLEQGVFQNNLILIDSLLPEILAEVVLRFYTTELNTLNDLTEKITADNPIGYDNQSTHLFYQYKIKKFLSEVALGMMPSKVWDGELEATGGYLIVKEDGEILCYHIYNRNQFENYLLNNTRLETASSSRHEFGKIFSEGGDHYIKLNLQIRFV